jgi:hypothetical protein
MLTANSPTFAAPAPPQPDLDQPIEAETQSAEPDKSKTDTITITPVPVPASESDGGVVGSEYFYRYRNSMSPRVGMVFNSDEYTEDKRILFLVGFQFFYQTRSQKSYESGLDLVSNSTGRAHFQRRWIFSRTRFRPYTKAGLGVKLVPRDGLATILKFTNFEARGAIGFERLLLAPLSLRMELELTAGPREFEAIASAGYSWAW